MRGLMQSAVSTHLPRLPSPACLPVLYVWAVDVHGQLYHQSISFGWCTMVVVPCAMCV